VPFLIRIPAAAGKNGNRVPDGVAAVIYRNAPARGLPDPPRNMRESDTGRIRAGKFSARSL